MPGTPSLRIRDADRHQHRCHHEARHEVVPEPGPLVVPQHYQPRNPTRPPGVCRMQGWTVDAARSGRSVGHGQVRSDNAISLIRVMGGAECMGTASRSGPSRVYLFASRIRAVIWSMYVITPDWTDSAWTPGEPPDRLPLWNSVTSTRTGEADTTAWPPYVW